MSLRINGSTSGYIEIDAPAVASNQVFRVPDDLGFASGTVMMFQQTAAPTGWTKITTHNDKALRVVSGAVSSGGVSAFSAVMNGSVGATTLDSTQIPSHAHRPLDFAIVQSWGVAGGSSGFAAAIQGTTSVNNAPNTGAAGGGGSHTHSMNVAYVDVIFASKN